MMKRIAKLIFILLFVFNALDLSAGLLRIKGVYNGKNLFIENKFSGDKSHHCITNIYVNDKHLLDHPPESVAEVNLSVFELNQELDIRIYHLDNCKPVILNPKSIERSNNKHFAFLKVEITEHKVHWETHGENDICKYTLQQKVNDDWKDIKNIKGNGTLSLNTYSTSPHHTSGLNNYRIKYRASGGKIIYSEVISYTSNTSAVYFYPKRVDDYITFETDDNREIEYSVTDINQNVIFKGKGIVVDCRKLTHSTYYILKYDNKEGRFYKKDYTSPEEE